MYVAINSTYTAVQKFDTIFLVVQMLNGSTNESSIREKYYTGIFTLPRHILAPQIFNLKLSIIPKNSVHIFALQEGAQRFKYNEISGSGCFCLKCRLQNTIGVPELFNLNVYMHVKR